MAYRPNNAGPRTLRELYHWVHGQLRRVADELEGGGGEPGEGEANTSSNEGSGAGLALPKSGVNLPFKSLVGGDNVTIDEFSQTVVINAEGGGGGDGEANTQSNQGTGAGLGLPKDGVDLPLKTLLAGSNVSITEQANTVTINASGGGGGGDLPAGGDDGETLRWNGVAWEANEIFQIVNPENVDVTEGVYLVDSQFQFQWDALIPGKFYVVGDSLSASNAGDGNPDSWLNLLLNANAIDATNDTQNGRSYSRPGTAYEYAAPPASPNEIGLLFLGANDAGGIDLGSGLAPGGHPADTTQAQVQASVEALIDNFLNDGYRVVVMKAPYNDIDELAGSGTEWDDATDLVNESILAACAAKGITEIWDVPTTNLEDYLHPSQIGHFQLRSEMYPRLVAVGATGAGGGGGDRNVDGGRADSIYLPSQNIDGGTASG